MGIAHWITAGSVTRDALVLTCACGWRSDQVPVTEFKVAWGLHAALTGPSTPTRRKKN